MMFEHIGSASRDWCSERYLLGTEIEDILPFVFYTLDSLYITTKGLPVPRPNHVTNLRITNDGTRGTVIMVANSYLEYLPMRLSLALTSDLYSLLIALQKQGNLMEIQHEVDQLCAQAKAFQDVRDFYTHLYDRLVKRKKHGINSALQTKCGVTYGNNAREYFHLVVDQNMIHFSDYNKAKEADVSRSAFEPIFATARNLYTILTTSPKVNAPSYPSAESLYPVFKPGDYARNENGNLMLRGECKNCGSRMYISEEYPGDQVLCSNCQKLINKSDFVPYVD